MRRQLTVLLVCTACAGAPDGSKFDAGPSALDSGVPVVNGDASAPDAGASMSDGGASMSDGRATAADTAPPLGTTIVASADFEEGDLSDAIYSRGPVAEADCRGRYCVEHVVTEACDQGVMTTLSGFALRDEIVAGAWFRFPADWSWAKSDVCTQSSDHKAIDINVADGSPAGSGRTVLSFWGGDSGGQFRIRSSGSMEPYRRSSVPMPTDGFWHYVEVHLVRVPGVDAGHVTVTLDGTAVIDESMTTCIADECGTINRVKFGSYHNYAYARAPQPFYLDDLVVADGPL